jgi:predicted acyl esterase
MLRVWRQEWVQPRGNLDERPGRWIAEDTWPSPRVERQVLRLGPGTLGPDGEDAERSIRGAQICGIDGGAWCADGRSDDVPLDQRADDGRSLCYTSEPLDTPLEILGFAEATLELSSDRPQALVTVRLCDVAPDGTSLLVTRGVLNLTHIDSDAEPRPLEPGRRYPARIQLDAIAHRFETGHRLRLSISPTYWPIAWPSPEPVTLTVHSAGSSLSLPARRERSEDGELPPLPEPEEPPVYPWSQVRSSMGGRRVEHHLGSGRVELVFDWDVGGVFRLEEPGVEHGDTASMRYSIVEGDPLSARVECTNGFVCRNDAGWDTSGAARAVMSSTATDFHVTAELEAFEGATRVWAKTWTFAFPRDNC